MKRIPALLALLLFAPFSYAEPPQWFYDAIKVDNPNELVYWATVSPECSFTKEELQKVVEGVFIRSRVKPLEESLINDGRIYLRIKSSCLELETRRNFQTFYLEIKFGRYFPLPAILYLQHFGWFGVDNKQGMLNSAKMQTEEAITEFIKANFDL